jgi:hypothetical protein
MNWTVQYGGSVEPDSAMPPWIKTQAVSTTTVTTLGDVLTLTPDDNTAILYYTQDLPSPTSLTFVANVKCDSAAMVGHSGSVLWIQSDPWEILIWGDKTGLLYKNAVGGSTSLGGTLSSFRTMWGTLDYATGATKIYIAGVLTASYTAFNLGSGIYSVTIKQDALADAGKSAYFDYVYWTWEGVYPPTTVTPLILSTTLRTTWQRMCDMYWGTVTHQSWSQVVSDKEYHQTTDTYTSYTRRGIIQRVVGNDQWIQTGILNSGDFVAYLAWNTMDTPNTPDPKPRDRIYKDSNEEYEIVVVDRISLGNATGSGTVYWKCGCKKKPASINTSVTLDPSGILPT